MTSGQPENNGMKIGVMNRRISFSIERLVNWPLSTKIMIDERTEFQIAQLADGTLDEACRLSVEELVASNVEARVMFDSYRKLDSALRASSVPVDSNLVSSDAVIGHIDNESARSIRIGWFRAIGSVAAAACLLVTTSVGLRSIWPSGVEMQNTLAAAPVIKVRGPSALLAANWQGEVVVKVSIGEPADLSLDNVARLYDDPLPSGRKIVISGIIRVE